MKPITVALAGMGVHARQVYIPSLDLLPEFRLTAVAASREETARAAGERFRVAAYAGYKELLERADAEAVIIATPSETLDVAARAALERGRHVLIETPGLIDREFANASLELSRRKKLVAQVGFCLRVAAPMQLLRSALARQSGPRIFAYEYFPFLSHIYNLALCLSGPVQEILAATAGPAGRTAVLQHRNGDLTHVLGRSIANCSVDIESVRVSGPRFYAAVEGRRRVRIVENMEPVQVEEWGTESSGGASYEPQPFAQRFFESSGSLPQLRAFARAIREGVPPASTLEDAIATKELALRLDRAAAETKDCRPVLAEE